VSVKEVEARAISDEDRERVMGDEAAAFDWPCLRKWNVKDSGACVRLVAHTVV